MGIRKLLQRAAGAFGYCLSDPVSAGEVRSLIQRLAPLDCGRPLVRIGNSRDGGYLLPDDLEGIRYCFSPGVNETVDFESQLADRGIQCFLADHSVNGPPIARQEFVFEKKFIGVVDRDPFMTMQSWKQRCLPSYAGELLLQMDIDGWEYEVILSTPPELLRQFRIIVVECHGLADLFERYAHRLYGACFDKLLTNFVVAHAHPNNCSGWLRRAGLTIPDVVEFTFYNRARVTRSAPQRLFPHPLDIDNCAGRPTLALPRCWYE